MRLHDALAARTEAVPQPGAADARSPYAQLPIATETGGCLAPSSFPPDARAVIRCPAPSAMGSGRCRPAAWVVEIEPRVPRFIDPLTDWTGGTDTRSQVRFSSGAAIACVERQGLRYEAQEPADTGTLDQAWQRPGTRHQSIVRRVKSPRHRKHPAGAPRQSGAVNHPMSFV